MTIATYSNSDIAPTRDKMDPGFGKRERPDGEPSAGPLPHDAVRSIVDTPQPRADKHAVANPAPKSDAKVERVVYFIVLTAMTIVPLLAFLFSFGNVGDLGTSLGVDYRIAYLTGPGVDLFVTALNVGATWLSHRGKTEKELWPIHTLSGACGLIMFALNCGPALNRHQYQLAAFDAVGPFLLIVMGIVGPWLLRQLAEVRQVSKTVGSNGAPESAPAVGAAGRVIGTAGGGADERTVPMPRRRQEVPTVPAAVGASADAVPTKPPTRVPSAPKPADDGSDDEGADVIDIVAAGADARRNADEWARAALPLYRHYLRANGTPPTAPQLADAIAAEGLGALKPSRARDIRRATEALHRAEPEAEAEPERAEAVS